jgi:hypothetical protein
VARPEKVKKACAAALVLKYWNGAEVPRAHAAAETPIYSIQRLGKNTADSGIDTRIVVKARF